MSDDSDSGEIYSKRERRNVKRSEVEAKERGRDRRRNNDERDSDSEEIDETIKRGKEGGEGGLVAQDVRA